MMAIHRRPSRAHPRGAILIVTIIITFILASMVIVLGRSMAVEAIASANSAAAMQAGAVERGAEQYALGIVADSTQAPLDLDEQSFEAVQVGDGYFWIVRPDYGDPSLPQFGLVDEAGKLDLNANANNPTVAYNAMMNLPGMTSEVAAGIIDWRDTNDTVDPNGGAESQSYLSQTPAYDCKNSNFETVEELLLVKGVTPQLLYGDGSAPPLGSGSSSASPTRAMGTPPSASDVQLAHGLFDYLTVYATQNVPGANGQPPSPQQRINVNTAPRDVLLCIDGLTSSDVDKLISARTANSTGTDWARASLGQPLFNTIQNQIIGTPARYSANIVSVSGNGRGFKHVRIVVDPGTSTNGATATPKIVYRRDLTDRGWPMDPQILVSLRAGNGPGVAPVGGLSR